MGVLVGTGVAILPLLDAVESAQEESMTTKTNNTTIEVSFL